MNKIINLFPITNNIDLLGNKVDRVSVKDGKVSDIVIPIDKNKIISYMGNIKKQNKILNTINIPPKEFTPYYNFYLRHRRQLI